MTAVAGNAPSANAFAREGLPVEYIDVYSTSMGNS
jgi:diacylglycerol O-acyltransferase / trehalose O-mycolyltransferase